MLTNELIQAEEYFGGRTRRWILRRKDRPRSQIGEVVLGNENCLYIPAMTRLTYEMTKAILEIMDQIKALGGTDETASDHHD